MEWLLFTYWLPPEPSRKRVYTWRQLKKMGALSIEGGGWLLASTDDLSSSLAELVQHVEEMGGTANLYSVAHFTDAQEQRAIERFRQEREREYSEIVMECHKALKHIEREHQKREFNFEEVEELEGDLEKIRRWHVDVSKRDHWDTAARTDVEKAMGEVEASLAAFVQKTYDVVAGSTESDEPPI
jgi:uncharacterized protein YdbL (DUF1318 family)